MIAPLVRIAMTVAHRLRVFAWRRTSRRAFGVHGVPLTPEGKVVLVRLTYASGWHLPGGAKGRREGAREGILRELREEIGLHAWTRLDLVGEYDGVAWGRPHHTALFIVHGARYRARWSLEIAEVAAFDLTALPPTFSAASRVMMERAGLTVPADTGAPDRLQDQP